MTYTSIVRRYCLLVCDKNQHQNQIKINSTPLQWKWCVLTLMWCFSHGHHATRIELSRMKLELKLELEWKGIYILAYVYRTGQKVLPMPHAIPYPVLPYIVFLSLLFHWKCCTLSIQIRIRIQNPRCAQRTPYHDSRVVSQHKSTIDPRWWRVPSCSESSNNTVCRYPVSLFYCYCAVLWSIYLSI